MQDLVLTCSYPNHRKASKEDHQTNPLISLQSSGHFRGCWHGRYVATRGVASLLRKVTPWCKKSTSRTEQYILFSRVLGFSCTLTEGFFETTPSTSPTEHLHAKLYSARPSLVAPSSSQPPPAPRHVARSGRASAGGAPKTAPPRGDDAKNFSSKKSSENTPQRLSALGFFNIDSNMGCGQCGPIEIR